MLVDALRPVLPALSDEIVDEIVARVPEYHRGMRGPFGRAVRSGVEQALERFLDQYEGRPRRRHRIYVELGRGEMRQGRSLDALLSAYRVGARVAWRRFVDAGREAGVSPDELYELGEAIFSYIDELSAESIEGFASEQADAASETARHRSQLVSMIVGESPAQDGEIERLAAELDWRAPRRLAVLLVDDTEPVGIDALVAIVGARTVGLLDAATPGLHDRLGRQLSERRAALGPAVDPGSATHSMARAQLALRVATEDGSRGLFVVERDLDRLLLGVDPALGKELAETVLAPLTELAPGPRAKLRDTLSVWLDEQGKVEATARALHVHAQTVRYRLAQLGELFGTTLDTPEGRFRLALALRLAHRDARIRERQGLEI